MGMLTYKIINNKLYITKSTYTIDFTLYNNNVAYKVNIYSLLSRLIIIFIWSVTPILFIIPFVFIVLLISCYRYNLIKFSPSPPPIPGGKVL